MKIKLAYLIPFFLLSACINKQKTDEKPPPLYHQAQTVAVNTDGGYAVNQVTREPIEPLVNSLGDIILTGAPIPATGKLIHPDRVSPSRVIPAPPSGSLEKHNAHPNVHKIPEELTVIPFNHDSLNVIPIEAIAVDDSAHYILNSTGDRVKTGVPMPIQGKKVKTTQPSPSTALSPRFKDAANTNLQYLDVDQGMASSYIYSILEDKNGNLWFGTYGGGVSKYDGASFTHYTEKEGLSYNYVRSILEDSKGNFWFGTYGGGVSKYDGAFFTHYTEKEGLSNNYVWSMLEDSKGNLWFGTYGGGVTKYDGAIMPSGQASFTHYTEKEGLSHNTVLSILEDSKGNLWFGTQGGGVTKYDGVSFSHYTEKEGLSSNIVYSILEDSKGNLWFGTENGGVTKYDGVSFSHYTEKEGLGNNTVLSILEDSKGNLWFGTEGGGVTKYDDASLPSGQASFTHYTEKEGLSNNIVWSILEDSKRNFWFGSYGGGITKYDGASFTHYTEKEGLSYNYVRSIIEDSKGNYWFGTYGGGVTKYDGASFSHYTEKEGLGNNYVWSMLEDSKGNLWFGTYGGGVTKYDGASFSHYTEKEGLSNNIVLSILEDSKGNLWFSTYGGGVTKYDGVSFTHYTEKEGLSNNIVLSILEDSKGNLWFGTNGGGVSKYNGASFTNYTEKEGLSNNIVWSILEDSKGNLWFGTEGGGVTKYDGATFSHFTEKEGLSNNSVWSMQEDSEGNLWLSTEYGLSQFVTEAGVSLQAQNLPDRQTGEKEMGKATYSIIQYVKNDGLKGLDFYVNSVCLDSKNRIWWGSGKGLTMLDLNKHTTAQNPPVVYLKQLDINEQFVDYRNISDSLGNEIEFNGVQRFENFPLNLELPYDQNHLTFHFAGIDWAAPHKIHYSYKIDGLDVEWSQPTKEAKANYRNLPYGNYIFKVRAIGESGLWSEAFEYKFTIHPPWWHTWWARPLYALATIFLLFSFVRWRTAKLKQRQKELETEVDNATKEIREQKEEVEQQKEIVDKAHQEIRDSINYAKRIQSAILPSQKLVKEYLPESFILYKPKDVVAGDFYWLEYKEGKTLFAAADCTGHGVPGAMVSVVCNNGLNRSVREYGLTEPAEILSKTRDIVIKEFEKSEEAVQDGMDISMCALNTQTNQLLWSGANNPIWIINKNRTDWPEGSRPFINMEGGVEIKPNKQAIGKVYNPQPFTTHKIQLQKGDALYIFSDGYQDQFGGEKGKKFKSINFKKLLLSIQSESMEKQREIIDKVFEEWRGEENQVDDVCVIGVKI